MIVQTNKNYKKKPAKRIKLSRFTGFSLICYSEKDYLILFLYFQSSDQFADRRKTMSVTIIVQSLR